MKLILEINNPAICHFDEKKLKLTVEETIKKSGLENCFKKEVLISLGLVSEEEIRKINQEYRKKDAATDVLSFANYEKREDLVNFGKEDIFLGEILLCFDDIDKYCQKEGIDFEREICKVLSHGVLHLLGFEHGEEMFGIQNSI